MEKVRDRLLWRTLFFGTALQGSYFLKSRLVRVKRDGKGLVVPIAKAMSHNMFDAQRSR